MADPRGHDVDSRPLGASDPDSPRCMACAYSADEVDSLLRRLDLLIEQRGAYALPITPYDALIHEYADRSGLQPDLVKAVVAVESNFDPRAVSRAGAMGLMQLMPGTVHRWGIDNPFDPEQNISAGVRHLAWLMDQFSGNISHVLAAYNAGENAVIRYRGIPPYKETQNYVRDVMALVKRAARDNRGQRS
ncbi:MAG: lytic transglycosylase domain-containing protein [Gammaproteobacteria bacterium]